MLDVIRKRWLEALPISFCLLSVRSLSMSPTVVSPTVTVSCTQGAPPPLQWRPHFRCSYLPLICHRWETGWDICHCLSRVRFPPSSCFRPARTLSHSTQAPLRPQLGSLTSYSLPSSLLLVRLRNLDAALNSVSRRSRFVWRVYHSDSHTATVRRWGFRHPVVHADVHPASKYGLLPAHPGVSDRVP